MLGATTFTWNVENQLTHVALPTGLTINYKYDALGRRIQRTTSTGANERYVYDGHDVLLDLNAECLEIPIFPMACYYSKIVFSVAQSHFYLYFERCKEEK